MDGELGPLFKIWKFRLVVSLLIVDVIGTRATSVQVV